MSTTGIIMWTILREIRDLLDAIDWDAGSMYHDPIDGLHRTTNLDIEDSTHKIRRLLIDIEEALK